MNMKYLNISTNSNHEDILIPPPPPSQDIWGFDISLLNPLKTMRGVG